MNIERIKEVRDALVGGFAQPIDYSTAVLSAVIFVAIEELASEVKGVGSMVDNLDGSVGSLDTTVRSLK